MEVLEISIAMAVFLTLIYGEVRLLQSMGH